MTKYLNNALLIDTIIAIVFCVTLFIVKEHITINYELSSFEIKDFGKTLIGISSTLIGFLLTIITLIVTLKKSHDGEGNKKEPKDYSKLPEETIFDKKISRTDQFYGSNIPEYVVKVLLYATYEMAIVTLILLCIQLSNDLLSFSLLLILIVLSLLLTFLAVLRSLLIFHLFIKVHFPLKEG